ncbi:flagellar biosynthetic protein FliO [Uliginosibacterium sp. H1]|uniref:flagellar biosynthetic protein FliO n=1 Tax=Uliginosibacterium sp. H1 TaxID=3114757 RepID=UPI002E170C53|nr:flagellar biosynthetic protein FliO [Uliginosibacterium sp. H1]
MLQARRSIQLLSCGVAALPVAAAAQSAGMPSASASFMQMILGLAVVLACLYGALLLLKKLQQKAGQGTHSLKVLGATAVGPRERVVLVSVGNQVLVLGVAPGRVNTLHTLAASDLPETPAPALPAAGDFANRLKALMERRRDA